MKLVLLFLLDMILTKDIEGKSLVWLANNNQYIIVEKIVAEILTLLTNDAPEETITSFLSDKIHVPYSEANQFINDIKKLLEKTATLPYEQYNAPIPSSFEHRKYYKINNTVFLVDFLSDYEVSLIHPKFAHLEVKKQEKINFHYQVFTHKEAIFFYCNDEYIGHWTFNESHFFQGKFSMKIIEHTHNYKEDDWIGIFHASAVSNDENAMLFLGDSGNGKSTSLALLQANGFTCLADDFVPVLAKNKEVYSFPSAISIKKNSLPVLLQLYPELESTSEYHFKKLNKVVRYLPPKNADYTQHKPCKKLVFIKYVPESNLSITNISKTEAFQQLVPDSWLSPIPENAEAFLNWFSDLNCYRLVYSDNQKMIQTVKKLFSNDL